MKTLPIVAVVLLSGLAAAFPTPFALPRPTAQEGRTILHEHYHDDHARFRSSSSMTMDVTGDPEFLDSEVSEDYDNDFDAHAFDVLAYSCVVAYNGGLASPFVSSFDSESTWVDYGKEGEVCAPAGIVGQLKETIANYLREPIFEVAISASVLMSCTLVAIDTVEGIPYKSELRMAENFISAVFAVDFFGRWFSSSKDFGRHVLGPQFALDVFVVLIPLIFGFVPDSIDKSTLPLPTWMTSPSTLINLKLIRVLRLRRVLQDMETFNKFERALGIRNSGVKPWQLQLGRVLLSLFTLLSVSSGLLYAAEHEVNPCFANYFSALYFGLITLSTVGFGDIVPLTAQVGIQQQQLLFVFS